MSVAAKESGFPLGPPPGNPFSFESIAIPGALTLATLQERCGAVLSKFPRHTRVGILEKFLDLGMEHYPVSCVGDLCALIEALGEQVRGRKVQQTGDLEEKKDPTEAVLVTKHEWKKVLPPVPSVKIEDLLH